jgi:RNA polymerase sigma factor (sigma-70 family)
VVDEREAELISLALLGSEDAFEELIRPHLAVAYRVAYRILQPPDDAEDRVWEAAVRAWRRLANLKPGRCFRPWFLGIVTRRCLEGIRNPWRSVIRLPDLGGLIDRLRPDDGRSIEADWLVGDELRRALAHLTPMQRAAIVLRYCEDRPIDEVAEVLGRKVNTVKSDIRRGLAQLRTVLRGSEVMPT